MKAKAAPPPGSAAFVHLRWPAALERTGGHRSSVRPLAMTQRNQKACESGLKLGRPQAAVAGSRMLEPTTVVRPVDALRYLCCSGMLDFHGDGQWPYFTTGSPSIATMRNLAPLCRTFAASRFSGESNQRRAASMLGN